jgi:hypothetical protein
MFQLNKFVKVVSPPYPKAQEFSIGIANTTSTARYVCLLLFFASACRFEGFGSYVSFEERLA